MAKTALLLVLVMLLAGCSDMGKAVEGDALPDVKYEYEGGTARYVSDDLVAEASYLSPERTDLYFSYFRDGRYRNPFTKSFAIFSLSLENRGTGRLSFEPRMAMLLPAKGDPSSALEYTMLYAELSLAGVDDLAGRMEAFKETCFDSQVTVMPGEKLQRLVVFTRDKEMGKKGASLVLEGIYMDHKPRTVKLLFKELL